MDRSSLIALKEDALDVVEALYRTNTKTNDDEFKLFLQISRAKCAYDAAVQEMNAQDAVEAFESAKEWEGKRVEYFEKLEELAINLIRVWMATPFTALHKSNDFFQAMSHLKSHVGIEGGA